MAFIFLKKLLLLDLQLTPHAVKVIQIVVSTVQPIEAILAETETETFSI